MAAGNEGRNNTYDNQGHATINAPANSPYVITVGAMNTLGTFDDLRRQNHQLQFQRSDTDRPYREAGSGSTRQPYVLDGSERRFYGADVSEQSRGVVQL